VATLQKVDAVSIGFGAVGGIVYLSADANSVKYLKSPGMSP